MSLSDTIDRYRIERQIGRGTTGVVYLAWDPVLQRRLAIKLLTPVLESDREARTLARLERELRAAGSFSHPNIVTVHDVGHQEDRPFIAMEYIEGETLEEIVRSGKELPPAQIVGIARQIGGALDHAHESSVVHRDVKLSNILLGADGVAKITDFGVAKVPRATETVAGAMMGTPSYMAPETLVGGAVTGASDQFSLAVALFELLTGERPFTGETWPAVVYRVVNEEPTSPRAHSPELPEAVDAVLLRALEKDPERRYPSCAELADALGDALGVPADDGVPAVAASSIREGSPFRRAGPGGLAKRAVWAAAALVVLLVVALLTWQGLRRPGSPSMEPTRDELAARPGRLMPMSEPDAPADEAGDRFLAVEPPEFAPDEELSETLASAGFLTARTFRIETEPPGARVYRNSELLEGVTPLEAVLEPSTHTSLRVEHDGYRPAGVLVSLQSLTSDQLARGVLFFPLRAAPEDPKLAADATVRLSIRLISEVRRGVVTVYWQQQLIVREEFRFEKTVGPASVGKLPGTLELWKELDPGPAQLRVYVALPRVPARMRAVTADLEAGSSPVLTVHVSERGPPRLELR